MVVNAFVNGDQSRVKTLGCRFSKPANPGCTLRVQMWRKGNIVSFRVLDKVTLNIVIDQAFVEFTELGKL